MTKRKKTLRAAVLASIFAMSICGWSNTVWAEEYAGLNYVEGPFGNKKGTTALISEGYRSYNPKLTNSSGNVSGGDAGSSNFSYDYNSFLQYYAYVYNNGDVSLSKDLVDRIVGVKFNEEEYSAQDNTINDTNTTISLKGVQLQHIEYDKDGNMYSPDGIVDFRTGVSLADSLGNGHYCGESAKSVSIGQLQRMNEAFYSNDKELFDGIMAEADARDAEDARLSTRIDNITLVNNNDGTFSFKDDSGSVVTTFTTNLNISSTTTNGITDKGTVTTYSITNANTDGKIGDVLDTNKYVTNIYHSDINAEGTDKGKLITTLIFNDNTNKTAVVDIGQYVTKNAGDAYYYKIDENGNKVVVENPITINQAITKNANDITTINQTIGDTNNFDNGVLNQEGNTTIVDAINNTYTEAKKHTTLEKGLNIVLKETTNEAGGKHYTISTATEVNFDKVISDVVIAPELYSDVGNIKEVISEAVHSDTALIGSKVYVDSSGINMNNSDIKNANNIDTNTITLGTEGTTNIAFDGGRITYGTEQIANLNDGLYYTGDVTTDEKQNTYAKLNKNVKIYGGATAFTEYDNIGVETTQDGDNVEMKVRLAKDIAGLDSVESDTVNVNNTLTIGDINTNIKITKDTININNKTNITENGMNINNKVVVEENNINVGGNTINNVAAGEISQNSTQAINGSQLYATNQRIEKLNGRVDKVGAGAAALAALHPLDFDPDDKLSFSAGVGNYGGETASALGMFYRPTEKVMLSAAGTMGNGENMVNMGVTFALDRKNNVSNSRVAMAREIQDLREQVAALTALVTQLAGRNNPALMDTVMFPDVPENHWAYDYIEGLQKRGIVEGYPDGNFGGDRSMTRYEYAAMLYRALEKGFPVDSRLLDEFDAELGRIRIDRIKGLDDDANKVERVRVNDYEDRDDYGSKLVAVTAQKQ